jgi:hypothetical protein
MLREQALPVTLGGGIDANQDRKTVANVNALDLQNVTFPQTGTLAKRNGYEALSTLIQDTGVDYGTPSGIAQRGDEILVFSNGRSYSHRPSSDEWAAAGEVSSVVAECRPIARTGTVQVIPDVAICNGIKVAAWEDSRGGIWCSVIEEDTGRHLLAQEQLSVDGETPRCVAIGENIAVLWTQPAAGQIKIALVATSSPTTVPTATLLTDTLSIANPVFDAESCGVGFIANQFPAVIAWADVAGGYRLGYLHESGVLGSSSVDLAAVVVFADPVTGPIAVTVERSSTEIVATAWTDASVNVRMHFASDLTTYRTLTPTAISSPTRITCAFGRLEEGSPTLWWAAQSSGHDTDLSLIYSGAAIATSTTLDATVTTLRGHTLLSRAFYDGDELLTDFGSVDPTGDVYVFVTHGARYFPYVACIRLSAETGIAGGETVAVARLLPGECPATHFRRVAAGPMGFEEIKHVSSVVERGRVATDHTSRRHAVPLSYRIQLDSEDGDQFAEVGIKYTTLDFDHIASYQAVPFGRGLVLASAGPQHYDGDRWTEAGYHTAPDRGFISDQGIAAPLSEAFVVSAGGDVDDGVHLYKCWYEDVDAQGQIHRGPVSVGVLVTTGAGDNTVTVEIPTYRLTNKRRVRVCVARSIAGATGTDEEIALYRVTSIDPADDTGNNRFVENDPTVDTVTFVDVLSDADLVLREPLYTNGGITSNDPAPWAGDVIAAGRSRLLWTDPSDGAIVRFTKSQQDDTGIEAPASFSTRVPGAPGTPVAIWEMDDAVYVGYEAAIYGFGGPGPLAAPAVEPQVNSFSTPALVTTDVGVAEASSVGATPIGTIFKSTKGIVMLGRDRQIARVGAMADGYAEQRVTRTTLLPDRPHILMLTDSGRTLLFDYERNAWSTYTNHEGWGAVIIDGTYHYLRTDGRVFKETPGVYSDAGQHIRMVIETAWLKAAGYLQGYQSVIWSYILGEFLSDHTLRMHFRRDYSETWLGPIDMAVNTNHDPSLYGTGLYSADLYGLSSHDPSTLYQRRAHLNQFCQAIQFRFEDVEAADDYGACFELTELLLICGVLSVKNPAGAARSS